MSVFCNLKYQVGRRICRSILSSLKLPGFTILFKLSYKWHKFRIKELIYIKCMPVFSRQILSELFLILGEIKGGITVKVHMSSRKVPDIIVKF
jgi:hypothetical protein